MPKEKTLTSDELQQRAIRFFDRYGEELKQVAELLRIKLTQLCHAYTLNHNLPPEAIKVTTRVKTLNSFLKKLKGDGWPQFYYPTEVVRDLIGARVVCWFVDDCYGILDFVKDSNHFRVASEKTHPLKDFIKAPQLAGYRAIHVFANLDYDGVQRIDQKVVVKRQDILSEIQIRSKLQDSWGDITHEFAYKAKHLGVEDAHLEQFLADVSDRFALEDRTLMKFRDTYQKMADDKMREGIREGLRDEDDEDVAEG